jgi:hypothetical protein
MIKVRNFFLASSLFLDANDMDVCKELNMQWMRKLKLNGVDAWIIQSKKMQWRCKN